MYYGIITVLLLSFILALAAVFILIRRNGNKFCREVFKNGRENKSYNFL